MQRLRPHFIVLALFVVFQILIPQTGVRSAPVQQTTSPQDRAQELLEALTPDERIGQLFLLDFNGTNPGPESQIYDLIVNRHIGGVILKAENDNFLGPDSTLSQTQKLTSNLQQAKWIATQRQLVDPGTEESYSPNFIPMLIGVSQPGDGYPHAQIYNGVTRLPSPLAIGATWNPELAEQVGFLSGMELSKLGINVLLGPSLDVLENPSPDSSGDRGVLIFGGDPYWVGQMGSAYVRGVHNGSEGRIAVIGKHFPGHGGSDRPPDEEVATVRKSLEQLKLIELAPFFAVAGDAGSTESMVDGLLISHIRYQGFQGNIRASTRPVSFDETAFAQIMSLPAFDSWRQAGGVMITDDLGNQAVRRFYDPSGANFNARLVVRDAFLAGSDLLYMGEIQSTDDPDSYTTILSVLDFFSQKYREDVAFAQRVDQSVLRILTLKFRLYETFELEETLPQSVDLELIGKGDQLTFEVAREAITLISPALADLDSVLPDTPTINDRIVIFTDALSYRQCTNCPTQNAIAVESLEQAILRLYALEAGNQVAPQNLFSYSFSQLTTMLDTDEGGSLLEGSIRNADWLVFGLLDVGAARPESLALRRLLAEREDLIRQKRVIVFSFNAPYYLDATEISKLTAYYGLYGKTPLFVETAARILFKELNPATGALPVSVPGIGYDLISATSPDPAQVIQVLVDEPEPVAPVGTAAPTETPIPLAQIGDRIPVRTGVIVDHNGNPVADRTPVQFIFNLAGEQSFSAPVFTVDGIARITFEVSGVGPIEIRAISELATQSNPLRLNVAAPEESTAEPSATPEPTVTPTEEPEPTATPTEVLAAPPEIPEIRTKTDLIDWLVAVLVSLMASLSVFRLLSINGQVRWALRQAICIQIGGMALYLYLALGMFGAAGIVSTGGRLGVVLFVLAGALIGWGLAFLWRLADRNNRPEYQLEPPGAAKTKSG